MYSHRWLEISSLSAPKTHPNTQASLTFSCPLFLFYSPLCFCFFFFPSSACSQPRVRVSWEEWPSMNTVQPASSFWPSTVNTMLSPRFSTPPPVSPTWLYLFERVSTRYLCSLRRTIFFLPFLTGSLFFF